MKVIVVGRDSSGKSTFVNEVKRTAGNIETLELNRIEDLISRYTPNDKIVFIQTPLILCLKRANRVFINMEDLKKQDEYLSYVTELPDCTIIKNDRSFDDFKVKIKKYVKSF
jgi:predicted kinase